MLEYCKTILHKVSFDGRLFEKELKKAIASLIPNEVVALRDWCYDQFGQIYEAVLNKCFRTAV